MKVNLPHTTHVPVLIQNLLVDVFGMLRVLEVRPNDEFAKVDLAISLVLLKV